MYTYMYTYIYIFDYIYIHHMVFIHTNPVHSNSETTRQAANDQTGDAAKVGTVLPGLLEQLVANYAWRLGSLTWFYNSLGRIMG